MKEKVRWESLLKTDPETKEQYWSREHVRVYKADEQDRINAVQEILKGETTAEDVKKNNSQSIIYKTNQSTEKIV